MIFYYIRHGDPIYNPDSLTPLGERQAEALGKRLALYGVDEVYASTSNRAILTAKPTCDLLGKKAELLDFANECYAWEDFTVDFGTGRGWLWGYKHLTNLFNTPEIKNLGYKWYEHPELCKFENIPKGLERVYTEGDKFLASLGYEHERYYGRYKVTKSNNKRVALFAHQGFGLAFLSCLLDIPYPMFTSHFDMCHSGLTVIDFAEHDGYAVPKVLTLSSDGHLYREGLPTRYNHGLAF